MCLCLCIFSAILLGILYLFFGAFGLIFRDIYGWGLWQIGCSFLGLLAGMVFAILSHSIWRRNYRQLVENHRQMVQEKGETMPEWRLPPGMSFWSKKIIPSFPPKKDPYTDVIDDPAIAGAPLVTIGLFIFAWTTYPHVHWIAPLVGCAIFGAGYVPDMKRQNESRFADLLSIVLFWCFPASSLFWLTHILCMRPVPWQRTAFCGLALQGYFHYLAIKVSSSRCTHIRFPTICGSTYCGQIKHG